MLQNCLFIKINKCNHDDTFFALYFFVFRSMQTDFCVRRTVPVPVHYIELPSFYFDAKSLNPTYTSFMRRQILNGHFSVLGCKCHCLRVLMLLLFLVQWPIEDLLLHWHYQHVTALNWRHGCIGKWIVARYKRLLVCFSRSTKTRFPSGLHGPSIRASVSNNVHILFELTSNCNASSSQSLTRARARIYLLVEIWLMYIWNVSECVRVLLSWRIRKR